MRRIKARVRYTLTKIKDLFTHYEQTSASQLEYEATRDDLKTKAYEAHRRIV